MCPYFDSNACTKSELETNPKTKISSLFDGDESSACLKKMIHLVEEDECLLSIDTPCHMIAMGAPGDISRRKTAVTTATLRKCASRYNHELRQQRITTGNAVYGERPFGDLSFAQKASFPTGAKSEARRAALAIAVHLGDGGTGPSLFRSSSAGFRNQHILD